MNQDGYTVGKLFAKTDCISQSMLMQYADGTLSKDDSRTVEQHLIDCPFCDEALDGMMLCGTQAFAALVDNVSEDVDQMLSQSEEEQGKVIEFRPNINPPMAATQPGAAPKRSGFRAAFPYMAAAASVALIVTLGVFFMGDSSSSIADRHFQMLESGTRRAVVPESPDASDSLAGSDEAALKLYQEAIALYEAKNYEQAAAIFDQDHNSKSSLFAGDCYYTLGKFDLAAIRYKKVIDARQGWEEQAEFNLALTYLKMDEVAQARMVLNKIKANQHHDFHSDAIEVLDDL